MVFVERPILQRELLVPECCIRGSNGASTFLWHSTLQYTVAGIVPRHLLHFFVPGFWQLLKSNLSANGLQHLTGAFILAGPDEAMCICDFQVQFLQ